MIIKGDRYKAVGRKDTVTVVSCRNHKVKYIDKELQTHTTAEGTFKRTFLRVESEKHEENN